LRPGQISVVSDLLHPVDDLAVGISPAASIMNLEGAPAGD